MPSAVRRVSFAACGLLDALFWRLNCSKSLAHTKSCTATYRVLINSPLVVLFFSSLLSQPKSVRRTMTKRKSVIDMMDTGEQVSICKLASFAPSLLLFHFPLISIFKKYVYKIPWPFFSLFHCQKNRDLSNMCIATTLRAFWKLARAPLIVSAVPAVPSAI